MEEACLRNSEMRGDRLIQDERCVGIVDAKEGAPNGGCSTLSGDLQHLPKESKTRRPFIVQAHHELWVEKQNVQEMLQVRH